MNVELDYFDQVRETRRYPSGGYYEHSETKLIKVVSIEAEDEIDLFEKFYQMNNRLRYCNGCYYKFTSPDWQEKYSNWLNSDDYKKKSFNLFYSNGIVD